MTKVMVRPGRSKYRHTQKDTLTKREPCVRAKKESGVSEDCLSNKEVG